MPPPWAVPLTETTGASLYGESPGVSSQSFARFLHVAQMCLKLHEGKLHLPLFQETQMRSSVSGLTGRRIGPPADGEAPMREGGCWRGISGCTGTDVAGGVDCSICMAQASAV